MCPGVQVEPSIFFLTEDAFDMAKALTVQRLATQWNSELGKELRLPLDSAFISPHAWHAKDLTGIDIVAVIQAVRLRNGRPRYTVLQPDLIQVIAPADGVIATEGFGLRIRMIDGLYRMR